ncbi:MAG: methyltransferase domain-containing protein [Candidatus Saccharibacteria bacterium]
MKSIIILGRQPKLGLAELESIYTAKMVSLINDEVALIDIDSNNVNFDRLGGAIKLASLIETTEISKIEQVLRNLVKTMTLPLSGKITLGISAYGLKVSSGRLNALALSLKKILRSRDLSIRVIPNREIYLNSAQVLHNKLATEHGIELLLVANKDKLFIGRTINVQNITDYTERDRGRPKRDSYVGMLPPKLAQIIINLASSGIDSSNLRLLDPFCGTGVILQEALLMGFNIYGTDIEPRMVDYSRTNIDWLESGIANIELDATIEKADACIFRWQQPINLVASESFLGQPLKTLPPDADLAKMIHNINFLHKKFFKNISTQLEHGTRLCLAVPAWYKNGKFVHLPLLDQLSELGYNRVAFEHAGQEELIYHRPDQIVARELVTIIRK